MSKHQEQGQSIRFEIKRYETPQEFIAPDWAYTYKTCEEIPYGFGGHSGNLVGLGYWWIELGGEHHTITDNEMLRDELLKTAYGVWDHIKNRCPKRKKEARYLNLEWLNFLPAKRESRRFVGRYVLRQQDLETGGPFEDTVACGGWTTDDHDPAGFLAVKENRQATIHTVVPTYGIPFRSLYSANIDNLFFAGRNASATHMAMSSTRVMGTCMTMGQAVGTGVGLMVEKGLPSPDDVLPHIAELQQRLLRDDCFLPGIPETVSDITKAATLTASNDTDPEPARDGWGRQIEDDTHAWEGGVGDWLC